MPGHYFVGFCLFLELIFTHKINEEHTRHLLLQFLISPPPPDSTMSLPVVTIAQEMMMKKRVKTKIGVGSVVKARVGSMEDNIRKVRTRKISKEGVSRMWWQRRND